jgi:adenylylsulfate kinase-like enzyme
MKNIAYFYAVNKATKPFFIQISVIRITIRRHTMSERHPIIAITGSSGAGTSTVTRTFGNIFRREGLASAIIEGDSYHRYDRLEMKARAAEAEKTGNKHFSHFGGRQQPVW